VVVVRDIVRAPHPFVGGDGDQQRSPGLEPIENRGERALVVDDMLKHVEQCDEVVGTGRKHREVGQGCGLDRAPEPLAGERTRAVVEFARLDPPEAAKHVEIVPGAAAQLEDAGIGGRANDALDHLGKDSAARGEPPVILVELGHSIEHRAVHQPSLPIVSRTT